MGARKHHYILEHLDQLKGSLVEIGAGRSEGSTDFYAGLAAGKPDLQYHSVDFDPEAMTVMKSYADRIANMHAYQMLGEKFLQEVFPGLNEQIAYAYLDNFDWIFVPIPPWVESQIRRYREFDLVLNNENSQLAHYNQTKLIVEHAADRCIIQFDDTFVVRDEKEQTIYSGKGGTAVPYLVSLGWRVVYRESNSVALANWQ